MVIALGFLDRIDVRGTEFGFVLIWVIEFFDSVVCLITTVLVWAILASFTLYVQLISALISTTSSSSSTKRADIRLVSAKWASPVLVIVVEEWASLQIMILRI